MSDKALADLEFELPLQRLRAAPLASEHSSIVDEASRAAMKVIVEKKVVSL